MNRNFRKQTVEGLDGSAQSEAWLFAQAVLGKPILDPAAAARRAKAEREQLEWLAQISTRHEEELRRLESAEAKARREREQLEWLASISTEHDYKLRALLREEREAREAQERLELTVESSSVQEQGYDPAKHPRGGYPENRGWWSPTDGSGGAEPAPGADNPERQTSAALAHEKLKKDDVLTYFKLLYGDKGQKLLKAFERAEGQVKVEKPWLHGDSAVYSRDAFGPPLIRIHDDLNPATAAEELMERLIEATGFVEVRSQLDHSGFANIETLVTSYKQSVKQAAATVAIASELYLSGIAIASEGANWVVTFSDLSEGNYYAAFGFLPLLPAVVGKTGVILKHGRKSLHISAEALQSIKALPVGELIALLESTRNLARNMVKAGIERPAGTAAHHIVPAALEKFPSASKARKILEHFNIAVENAANGVYLPSKLEDAVKAAYHRSLHTRRYSDEVLRQLQKAKSKEDALLILNEIRKRLLAGTFPH